MIDIFLHFSVSLGIASALLLILLPKNPRRRTLAPRFWESESQYRSAILTLVIAFSLAGSILVGIGKEWMDGMGFGNVEFTDFLADIAGVATAVYLLAGHAREKNQVRRHVTFRSRATSKEIEPDLIIPPPKWDDPSEKR